MWEYELYNSDISVIFAEGIINRACESTDCIIPILAKPLGGCSNSLLIQEWSEEGQRIVGESWIITDEGAGLLWNLTVPEVLCEESMRWQSRRKGVTFRLSVIPWIVLKLTRISSRASTVSTIVKSQDNRRFIAA